MDCEKHKRFLFSLSPTLFSNLLIQWTGLKSWDVEIKAEICSLKKAPSCFIFPPTHFCSCNLSAGLLWSRGLALFHKRAVKATVWHHCLTFSTVSFWVGRGASRPRLCFIPQQITGEDRAAQWSMSTSPAFSGFLFHCLSPLRDAFFRLEKKLLTLFAAATITQVALEFCRPKSST